MKDATLVTTLGRDPAGNHGIVNPPVYHASTILFPSLAAMDGAKPGQAVYYGRYGTPTTHALEDAVARLEGGYRAIAVGSGKTAISGVLLGLLKAGDHILVVDTAYGPTRHVADTMLAKFGVETTYYAPGIGAGIERLLRPNTRLVFTEAPGSLTFEMQDIPAIAQVARRHGVLTVIDNTWASPLYFKPFEHGVDISIQAGTKYITGHSDVMMGIVTTTEAVHAEVRAALYETASAAAPDDCYLALRGLRTMATRLERHQKSMLEVAAWLAGRPEVTRLMCPALPEDPGHALWKRDFLGASGLFGFVMRPCSRSALAAMLDSMELFGMGYSWGGFESLLIPTKPAGLRTATPWSETGQAMRIHVGLEDPADLIADLEAGFARLAAAT
ncbi:cystathionine beta-lyase [Geminicoccaceae bacterium 1502E]|nr:cystathionine beta-lyase [Geminicoccaceae bacterium 1502E]